MIRYVIACGALGLAACSGGGADDAADDVAETAVSEEISPAPADAEEDIRHFLLQEYPEAEDIRYALAWSDLDGDGTDEAIVHVVSSYLCGSGGCNTLVLTPAGPMWRKVGDISVSRTPISVLDSQSNGWNDITVAIAGGGGPSGNGRLAFDGDAYPSNPTVAPAELTEATGTELIGEEPELVELSAKE